MASLLHHVVEAKRLEGVQRWRTAERVPVKLRRHGVDVGHNSVSLGPLCSALCALALWRLLQRCHVGAPSQEALFPSLAVRAEDRVVYHVVVATALACAWGRHRRESVEVTVVLRRQVSDSALP